jgi:hypothetical protein
MVTLDEVLASNAQRLKIKPVALRSTADAALRRHSGVGHRLCGL